MKVAIWFYIAFVLLVVILQFRLSLQLSKKERELCGCKKELLTKVRRDFKLRRQFKGGR